MKSECCIDYIICLLFQVDEPKDNFDDAIEESIAFREPEAGFKGNIIHKFIYLVYFKTPTHSLHGLLLRGI